MDFITDLEKTNIIINSNYINHSLECIALRGNFSYLNLDNFINLKRLSLCGNINESFNFELFKKLCNQLESLSVEIENFDEENFFKLFDGHHFSNLKHLNLFGCCIKSVKRKFIDQFPMLQDLYMNTCKIELIENDVFSNLKQLEILDFSVFKPKESRIN